MVNFNTYAYGLRAFLYKRIKTQLLANSADHEVDFIIGDRTAIEINPPKSF
jgi:hypothetical protein